MIGNLKKLEEINNAYELSNQDIETQINDMEAFKVCTPIIGGFSTGKSSLINVLLEENILKTDITPETSVPTEISYGKNNALIYQGENVKQITLEEFEKLESYLNETDLIAISYENEFFSKIPDVKLVDMPGFDSGIESHNRAIENYLIKSLAYVITFSADDMIIKESIANFLKELNLYEVPICVVITKCDKVTQSRLEHDFEYLKETLPKYINTKDVKFYFTKSKKSKNAEELKEFFLELQKKSQEIFRRKYTALTNNLVEKTEIYLQTRIKNIGLSISDLEEKEENLKKEIHQIKENLEKERTKFEKQIENCVSTIKFNVEKELNTSSNTLASLVSNGMDISDKVNMIVRSSVSNGIKREFEPKVQKYFKNIAELISINPINDITVERDSTSELTDDFLRETLSNTIPTLIPMIGGAIAGGAIASIPFLASLGSLIGPIGTVIGASLGTFINSAFKVKKVNELKAIATEKVQSEIIPNISRQVEENIDSELRNYVQEINNHIALELSKKSELLQKSLEDIKQQRKNEEESQTIILNSLESDLQKVRGLKLEYR